MQLTTVRTADGTRAARVEGDTLVLLDAADVGAALRSGVDVDADGSAIAVSSADYAPLITHPDKIVCVGANYLGHIKEMGREQPKAPTYFAKYRRSLIGARDDIVLPPVAISTHADWEAELTVVIGAEVRHADAKEAFAAIAGFTVLNDVSMRDYQRRTTQFLAGKTFESTTPVGPVMVTTDEIGDGSGLAISTEIDGVLKQSSNTAELCFNAVDIVADLSRIITLEPGDIIATGTPSGVGAGRTPPEWMTDGTVVRCSIDQIGETLNTCRL